MKKNQSRVVIEDVLPQINCGEFYIKRVINEFVNVSAVVLVDGHDIIASSVLYKHEKVEEALKISEKAKLIAMKQNDKQWETFIANHSQQIKNRKWNEYR